MSPTPLGIAAWTAAWSAFGAAFLVGSWGMALGCAGAMAVLASTRRRLLPARPDVRREAPATVQQGALVTSRVLAAAPGDGLVDLDAPVPPGFTLVHERRASARGQAVLEQDLQPVAVGSHAWPPVEVAVTDAWGLESVRTQVAAGVDAVVVPDPQWALHGRRLGLRNPVQATVKAATASETSLEVERVRPYMPGDRLRDIDWKATSRFQETQVRERERHKPRPVTVVLDCLPSMRVQRADMKLLSAARVAHGTLAAATGAGTTSHLVALHEERCVRRPVSGLRDAEAALAEVLASCPPLAPSESRHPGPSAAQVLLALGDSPGLIVAVVDAEADPEYATELLALLAPRGQVAVVIPATGSHLYRRREARPAVVASLRAWRANRDRVARAARALRMPCWVLRPGNEGDLLARIGRMLA